MNVLHYLLTCLLCMYMSVWVYILMYAGHMYVCGRIEIYVGCLLYLSSAWVLRHGLSPYGELTEHGWPMAPGICLCQSSSVGVTNACHCAMVFCMDAGYQHLSPHMSFFAHEVNTKWLSIKYMPPPPISHTALYPHFPCSLS